MKIKRRLWIEQDKPRSGELYNTYKSAKCKFRKAHRAVVTGYLNKLDHEIDTAAECDNNEFWKLVNRRRKRKTYNYDFEMIFNGVTYNDPRDINTCWQSHFSYLYSPSQDSNFDEKYKLEIETQYDTIIQNLNSINGNSLVINDTIVSKALKTCKKGKACGNDKVYYENVMYGGDILIQILAKLFNAMLALSHTPTEMKKGIITTLFKGGGKRKNDPNSYRAISLCSVILKLYEKVILLLLENDGKVSLNPLQGGFQKHVNCTMTSFMLRECICYGAENNSKVYACFLDAKQAFDRTWIKLLLLKLYKTGIDPYLFKTICSFFSNCFSCVKSQGLTSDWFPILQGTRQGQCISPHLYLVFINDLMNTIVENSFSLNMGNIYCGCPTSADDMVVLSFTKKMVYKTYLTYAIQTPLKNDTVIMQINAKLLSTTMLQRLLTHGKWEKLNF